MAISGLIIALTAPVMGQRADQPGRRSLQVALWTALTVACMAAMALVADDTAYFWLGLVLLAAGSIAFEFAEIGYFSMLPGIATPQTVGRVSGLGWGMGYVGGIVVLGIAFVGFLAPAAEPGRHGILNLPAEGGLNVRAFCLLAAAWFLLFALPLLVAARRRERRLAPNEPQRRLGVRASYAALFREIKALWRGDRRTALFFLAAAVYRDGLAGVFGFGAVLAATVYGLSPSEIILFGIAGNVAAAAGAFAAGVLDDRFGPKPVICASLALMVLDGLALFFVEGPAGFWALGLALCLLVGPAQSASRTFLVRVTPKGREGQFIGLYATSGRAVSFLAPGAFALFTGIGGDDRYGILAIALVLAAGLAALVPLAPPARPRQRVVSWRCRRAPRPAPRRAARGCSRPQGWRTPARWRPARRPSRSA